MVKDVTSRINGFSPKISWNFIITSRYSFHFFQGPIFLFYHLVLLRCPKSWKIMAYSILIAEFLKFLILKLTTMVTSNWNYSSFFLIHNSFKELYKRWECFILMCQEWNHVNLEKSSIMTSLYLLPPKLVVLVGPKRSMCMFQDHQTSVGEVAKADRWRRTWPKPMAS